MKKAENTITTDILIIGSGLAGCASALAAAREGLDVILITSQENFLESSSNYAQGGIIYRGIDDSLEKFVADFRKAGNDLVYEKAVKLLFEEGPRLIDEILIKDLKIPFSKDEKGKLHLTLEGAHSVPRILHVEDRTGESIQRSFYRKLQKMPNIKIYTKATAIDLITLAHHSLNPLHIYEPSTCSGAYVFFQEENRVFPVLSKFTILATGGLGRIYLHTSNPECIRGDGYAMAYRAGARIMNMEYVQFHPTTLYTHDDRRFLITEAVRGEGGILRNRYGEDFMKKYHPEGSLAPRDVVARSIIKELTATGGQFVYLDLTHKESNWIKQRFPNIYKKCLEEGIDITSQSIPVVPAAHYECGGVATNLKADTTIKRLKAVGEVACTGVHGANRLASSSLLECLVFGYIAGKDCARRIKKEKFIIPNVPDWKAETEEVDPELLLQDWLTIKHTMWNYAGIVRTRKKLERAYGIIMKLKQDIEPFYANGRLSDNLIGLRNAATVALLVLHAAKLNKKSRGCHYRVD